MESALVNVAVIPLIIIFSLVLRRLGILKKEMAGALGFVGFNIGLSALIFLAFLQAPLRGGSLLNPVIGFFFAASLFIVALGISKMLRISDAKKAVFVISFATLEGGSIAYPFFAAIFGSANLPQIVLFDLGHAVFAFTILTLYFYRAVSRKGKGPKALLKGIFAIPILPAMFAGIILNLAGISLSAGGIAEGVLLAFLGSLGAMAIPLILISLALNLKISLKSIRGALVFAFGSLGLTALLALIWSYAWNFIPLAPEAKGALFVMALAPPAAYAFMLTEQLGLDAEIREYAAKLFSVTVFVSLAALLLLSVFLPGLV